MARTPTPPFPLRVAEHFVARLHERFPKLELTEGRIQEVLLKADWYPARGSRHTYYALARIQNQRVTFVVALDHGVANVITLYEPRPGWSERLDQARPWPLSLVLAFAS